MAIHRKTALVLALCVSLAHAEGTGRITGFVKFPGETPPRNMFANASDHDCPHGIGQNHLFVKQETLGLQNALVILESEERRVMPTRLQAELRAEGCRLLPRIQWLPLGTSLSLVNKDEASHHFHAYQRTSTLFEAKVEPASAPARRPLVVPGFYKINCDRHPWERAWIYVSPHDAVAVTDAEGRFIMKNVSPGRYKIRVWHEGWVPKRLGADERLEFIPMQDVRDVKVRENQESSVTFDTLIELPSPI